MPELSGLEVIKEIKAITRNMNEQLIAKHRQDRGPDQRIHT